MSILLIRPRQNENDSVGIPLGLLYIASVLKKNEFDVKVIDCANNNIQDSNLKHIIKQENPEIIGITNQYSIFKENAINICRMAKKINENVTTIIGGNHATVSPEDFLTEGFDIVVRGEGEFTMLDIVNDKPLSKIRGISYVQNQKIKNNMPRKPILNLDNIPLPAYEMINMEDYFVKNARFSYFDDVSNRSISVITSRGCPNNCCFCSVHLSLGHFWRPNSVEYVLNHLQLLTTKYGVKNVDFEDDNLTFNPKRFEAILDGMKERGINITWRTPNGVRVDTLNRRLLRKMRESGLKRLVIGVESGSQRVIDNVIDKKIKLKDVVRISKIAKEEKISLSAFFIIGLPGETKSDINKTLNFALMLNKKYGVVPQLTKADARVGTRMTEACMKNNYLKNGRISTEEFTAEDIDALYKDFYRNFLWSLPFKINIKNLVNYRKEIVKLVKSRIT